MLSRRTLRVAIAGLAATATLISLAAFSALPTADSSKAVSSSSSSSDKQSDKQSDKHSSKNSEVTIYLTRHGETWFNTLNRMQGWSDSPLTEEGILDAEHLGAGLAEAGIKFKAAYSADMGRHYQTTTLALNELGYKGEPVRDERLREISFGSFEGATQAEVFAAVAPYLTEESEFTDYLAAIVTANGDSPMIAETSAQLTERVMSSLNEIAAAQSKKGGGNVLVVSSGITIMAALASMGADLSAITDGIDNAAVSKLTYKKGVWTVVTVNDSSYVEAGAN